MTIMTKLKHAFSFRVVLNKKTFEPKFYTVVIYMENKKNTKEGITISSTNKTKRQKCSPLRFNHDLFRKKKRLQKILRPGNQD